MQKSKALLVLILAVLFTAAAHGGQADAGELLQAARLRSSTRFYVSPFGSDDNLGTEAQPFKTLQRARDEVRLSKAASPTRDVHVILRGGTYYLPEGIALGPEDSGTEGQKIIYVAYPDEVPVLIGGVRLGGIRPYKDGVYVADLPAGCKGRQLFENNVRMTPARSPNAGYFYLEKGLNADGKLGFVYRAGDLDPASWDVRDAVVNIWPYHDWHNSNYRLRGIDAASRTLVLDTNARELREGNRFYVQNVLALLDAPGECCIAHSEGKVYFRPRTGRPQDNDYVISTARALISVEGTSDAIVRNVHFEGLDLTIADEDVILFNKAEDCSVRSCRIENARDSGIEISDHAQNIVIYGNEIREHGMHGVMLGGRGPGREDVNHHNTVENNHIHHCGRIIGHGNGVFISQSGHNRILHNHIHHMPRYATTIKGNRYQSLRQQVKGVTWENRHDFLHSRNNLLAFNHLHHVNQDSQDTGAMECWGPGRDNVFDHNLIHDTGNDEFNLQSGIYLDDAADYFTVTNNIIYGVRGTTGNQPIFTKGIGNRIENNILIVDRTNDSAIRSFFMADERCDHHTYVRNIICFQNNDLVPEGALGSGMGNLHAQGTTLTWPVNVAGKGNYAVWLLYAAYNEPHGTKALDGRFALELGGRQTVLNNLPDTGAWGKYLWNKAGMIELPQGEHILKLVNLKGGGMNLDAIALCDDEDWTPAGNNLAAPQAGRRLLLVQAESWLTRDGEGRRANVYNFNNWSDDRVSASDYNVFWHAGGNVSVKGSPADGSLDKWRQLLGGRFDRNSIVADPMFVDAANRDYRLKPESPALKLGFKPINTAAIGLKADFPARLKKE
ncbi:MAG: right-handed parallel beta-helix repeat-containing protein [Phycisphaerae bacterium]|nr:right-handed parallel beta-helix repeat-containing protein [Phycisphaerae bacterium]